MVVCGTCLSASELAGPLRAPGRLDRTIVLEAPGTSERASLLQSSLQSRGVGFSAEQLQALAARADGFDAADLQALTERAVHAAVQRQMSQPTAFGQGGCLDATIILPLACYTNALFLTGQKQKPQPREYIERLEH